MSNLRIGIAGCGGIAGSHIEAIMEVGGADVVALTDCLAGAALAAAEKTGGKAYVSLEEMLTSGLDALVIATPPKFHRDIAIAALRAGGHVLCEKPLAFNAFEAQEMVEAARANDRILMTAFCHRFHEPVMMTKELIGSGRLGPVVMFRNRFGGKADMAHTWFGNNEIAGGGVIMDTSVHSVDLFRYLVGDIKNVSAKIGRFDQSLSVEDMAILLLESADGVIGTIEGSWATPASANVIEVYGNDGAAVVDYSGCFRYFIESEGDWTVPNMTKPGRFVLQMAHFLECVRESRQPQVTGEDGLAAMKAIEAAYRSVETGCAESPEIATQE